MPEAIDPDEAIQEVEEKKQEHIDEARNILLFFMENIGDLYNIDDIVSMMEDEQGMDSEVARRATLHLATDKADPVQIVSTDDGSLVGIIEFMEGDFWYGYEQYDDTRGRNRRIVCSQCVSENRHDSDVGVARGHDFEQDNIGYDEISQWFYENHFEQAHSINPGDVELDVGASLASGTTIGGNESWHNGNVTGGTGISVGSTSISSHSRYQDSEAIGAVEAANPLSLQNDLSIPEGNSVEDGDNVPRIDIFPSATTMSNDAGNRAFRADDGADHTIFARSDTPIKFIDDEGNFTAVRYLTSPSRGSLRMENAIMDHRLGNNETVREMFPPDNNDNSNSPTFDDIFWTTSDGNYDHPGAQWRYYDRPGTANFATSLRTADVELNIWTNEDGGNLGGFKQTALYVRPGRQTGDSPKLAVGGTAASDGVLQVFTDDGSGLSFIVRDTGEVGINDNIDASSSDKMTLPQRTSDPTASAGDMWYRTDLD